MKIACIVLWSGRINFYPQLVFYLIENADSTIWFLKNYTEKPDA